MKFDDVRELALELPETAESTAYGTPCFRVRKQLFPRLREDGTTLVVRVDPWSARRCSTIRAETYFITPHYKDYPYILVGIEGADPGELREPLVEAWLERAPKRLAAAHEAELLGRQDYPPLSRRARGSLRRPLRGLDLRVCPTPSRISTLASGSASASSAAPSTMHSRSASPRSRPPAPNPAPGRTGRRVRGAAAWRTQALADHGALDVKAGEAVDDRLVDPPGRRRRASDTGARPPRGRQPAAPAPGPR